MKFERVLHVYWTRGFVYGGQILPFDSKWWSLGSEAGGMGFHTRIKFVKRFELYEMQIDKTARFSYVSDVDRLVMNLILSRAACMNYPVKELQYLNLVRLFMNRSMRGRSQALGKPSHGQRTWSNAWTAYKYNKTIRIFVAKIQRQMEKEKKEEKVNYKLVQKKVQKSKKEGLIKGPKKKSDAWF